jgi:hypothetical protein
LPDAHPFEQIDVLLENGISFVRKGGGYDFFDTGSTRAFGEQSRVNAVAGNDSQVAWNIHRIACHSERSEAESKNPAKLLQSHATDSSTSLGMTSAP